MLAPPSAPRDREVLPEVTDTTVEEWRPTHADLTWANVTGPEFYMINWEDRGHNATRAGRGNATGSFPRRPGPSGTCVERATAGLGEQARPADGAVLVRESHRATRTPRIRGSIRPGREALSCEVFEELGGNVDRGRACVDGASHLRRPTASRARTS